MKEGKTAKKNQASESRRKQVKAREGKKTNCLQRWKKTALSKTGGLGSRNRLKKQPPTGPFSPPRNIKSPGTGGVNEGKGHAALFHGHETEGRMGGGISSLQKKRTYASPRGDMGATGDCPSKRLLEKREACVIW